MKIVAIVASTSLLLMSAVSFAQSQPVTPMNATTTTQDVATIESSEPSRITAERQKAVSEHYTKLDANKDGKLSASEFNATPKTGKDFVALDSDKDGSLTMMEFSKNQMK